MIVALEELQDLKGVWVELSKVWEQIEELREKPWLSVAPKKVRQALDGLLGQLKASLPGSSSMPPLSMYRYCSRAIPR